MSAPNGQGPGAGSTVLRPAGRLYPPHIHSGANIRTGSGHRERSASCVARSLGHGGIKMMTQITGLGRETVARGIRELAAAGDAESSLPSHVSRIGTTHSRQNPLFDFAGALGILI